MGDAAGELSESSELVGVSKLFFEAKLIRGVVQRQLQSPPAMQFERECRHRQGSVLSVRSPVRQ